MARIAVPERFAPPAGEKLSTQDAFGRFLSDLARRHPELADRVVMSSPDVTVSTSLGSWLNRRRIFGRRARGDLFRDERILSALNWEVSARGQHIELGIAENNLFILPAALGLSAPLFGERLLPIGTLYDPFISRGLDALNDAHPATLSWLASVRRQRVVPLGVERFGQSGDLPDLYREYRLDVDAIIDAAARVVMPAGV